MNLDIRISVSDIVNQLPVSNHRSRLSNIEFNNRQGLLHLT